MGENYGWGKMPQSLTKQFALNIYSKIRVQAVSLKLKNNIINNYELQNYNSLFEKKKLTDD